MLYIDQEKFAEANEVLDLLPASAEVDQLRSIANMAAVGEQAGEIEAKLAEDPTNRLLQIEYAKAVAGQGQYAVALDGLLIMVEDKIEEADEARAAVIEIFGVSGTRLRNHPNVPAAPRQRSLLGASFALRSGRA